MQKILRGIITLWKNLKKVTYKQKPRHKRTKKIAQIVIHSIVNQTKTAFKKVHQMLIALPILTLIILTLTKALILKRNPTKAHQ